MRAVKGFEVKDFRGADIVFCPEDDFRVRLERGVGEDFAHGIFDVDVFRQVGLAACFPDCRGDLVEKRLERGMAVMAGMAGALHRAASGVAEDEDERRVKVIDRIFKAAHADV